MNKTRPQTVESAIYQGIVRHRRTQPTGHHFDYPIFMFLLKLKELPDLFSRHWQLGAGRWSWARFRREDYIGEAETDLESAAKEKIAELQGMPSQSVEGDIFLLCHLRYLGFYFSPLNLYFLRQQGEFRCMLAEVSNTPWNERHYYLVDLRDPVSHPKAFHVSPFNPMSQTYRWHVVPPSEERSKCIVNIQSSQHCPKSDQVSRIFDATLNLTRQELNHSNLRRVLLKTPAQTISVVRGIYWQALKLFIKRAPLYPHPGKKTATTEKSTI